MCIKTAQPFNPNRTEYSRSPPQLISRQLHILKLLLLDVTQMPITQYGRALTPIKSILKLPTKMEYINRIPIYVMNLQKNYKTFSCFVQLAFNCKCAAQECSSNGYVPQRNHNKKHGRRNNTESASQFITTNSNATADKLEIHL